ncbi:hypothetical protein AOL_s00215g656 [Orbilia oligospora ATCC 24927]|uniref:Uncharacterized protein n=1 Tax=Arthrobotrys oligospora (strain ATCC 24927 / CBS 115.81 / DSM 1491) TaxID=756982 RepID=G1XUJ8_ARTOA|nr:hypothetical protein AOL_s00215g656 [Orbilia oligospora ATCC 24927]EGX43200.1 hypothetical protein AOL_s00215g656 [Orbilia oligospora ATCC 24927]
MSTIDSTNSDGVDDSLGGFVVPSNIFSIDYYHGLPSKPPLLATTKPQPYINPIGFFDHPVAKTIHAISGKNPIVSMWDSGISNGIMGVLKQMDIEWTSLEAVHIPVATDPSLGPAIVWIGVQPGTLSYRKAAKTALMCQEVIDTNSIADCFVEIRSSVVRRSGGDGGGVRFIDLFKVRDLLREEKDPFTATLSFPISAKGTLDPAGSAGFFLDGGSEDNNIYLVTARHVALVESFEESQVEYTKTDTNQPKKEIVRIGSNADLQQIVGDMASKIESLDERGLAIENAIENAIANGTATPDDRASLTLTSSKVAKLEDLHKYIDTQWGTVESRVLGELVWAPPISFSIQPGCTTLDLAVIKIGPGILDEKNFLGNVIHFGDRLTNAEIREMIKKDPTIATSFKIPEDRLVRLHGQTPKAEVATPSTKDSNGENCPIVFKHGPKSGVTFGKASCVSCYTRRIWEGVEILSRELGVIGIAAKRRLRESPFGPLFSEAGDSGACVADAYGRISGIVIGGSGFREGVNDITYVTPIHLIMEALHSTKMFQNAHLDVNLT